MPRRGRATSCACRSSSWAAMARPRARSCARAEVSGLLRERAAAAGTGLLDVGGRDRVALVEEVLALGLLARADQLVGGAGGLREHGLRVDRGAQLRRVLGAEREVAAAVLAAARDAGAQARGDLAAAAEIVATLRLAGILAA